MDSDTSYFQKTVTLRDWWLVISDGDKFKKGLAVSGFTCTGKKQAMRVFHSAAITKRFDAFTVETADGIIVVFQGFINKLRTAENGFSSEVFKHFLFGFPPCWEECAGKWAKQARAEENDVGNIENNATENRQPSSSSPKYADSLMKDKGVVEVGSSSNHAVEPSERSDDHESNKKSKESIEKSINEQSAFVTSVIIENDASKESLILESADMRNPDASIQSKKSEKMRKQIQGNKRDLICELTNVSTASLSQDPKAVLGCVNEEEVGCDDSVLTPTVGDSGTLEQCLFSSEDTAVQAVIGMNDVTQSPIKRRSEDAIPSNSDCRRRSRRMANLNNSKNHKPVSGCSVKHQKNDPTPDLINRQQKRRLKNCSHPTLEEEPESPQVFNNFLFGFPPCGEEGAGKWVKQARTKENDIGNVENNTTENLQSLSSCPKNADSLMEDNGVVKVGPSSNHAVESSERLDDYESNKKSKESIEKSRNEQSAPLTSVAIENDTLKEGSLHENADMSNPNASIQSKKSEKMIKQIQGNKYEIICGLTNVSTASLSQDPRAVLGCVNEEEVRCDNSVLSPTVAEMNDVTQSAIKRRSEDAIPSNSDCLRRSRRMANLNNSKNHEPVSGCSLKHKKDEATPDLINHLQKRGLKNCSRPSLGKEPESPQVILKTARRSTIMSENCRKKVEQLSVKRGGLSVEKTRRKSIHDAHKSTDEKIFLSPESLNLKRSRSGRLLLPTLDFWRNQIPLYDAGTRRTTCSTHRVESYDRNISGILEEKPSRGSKSEPQKKQKRR
ncbi:kinetochore-associated protein KNL-2 homolog isoform X2 [Mercurialis annua]|uniref:kinetochore-associated protein KNL-2 homolog isoform X2 n=1 Tax=Mercurialis annua TaxID=3986 RepID=UPI00215F2675|nr:kinetochore-associated protein KNL-2 homolog isoform X2 [Mercurialis annua]